MFRGSRSISGWEKNEGTTKTSETVTRNHNNLQSRMTGSFQSLLRRRSYLTLSLILCIRHMTSLLSWKYWQYPKAYYSSVMSFLLSSLSSVLASLLTSIQTEMTTIWYIHTSLQKVHKVTTAPAPRQRQQYLYGRLRSQLLAETLARGSVWRQFWAIIKVLSDWAWSGKYWIEM